MFFCSLTFRPVVGVEGYCCSWPHSWTPTHTLGGSPVVEGLVRRRVRYLYYTQHSQKTNIHAPSGIRTRNPSKRAAAGQRRRLRGCWGRLAIRHMYRNLTHHVPATGSVPILKLSRSKTKSYNESRAFVGTLQNTILRQNCFSSISAVFLRP